VSLFRKKRIGIYGGTFDPPTMAHSRAIYYAKKKMKLDHVIVMPCGDHRFKEDSTPFEHRFAMSTLKFLAPDVSVSSYEKDLGTGGSAYSMLCRLTGRSEFMDRDFRSLVDIYYIIGQDCADEIETWDEYKHLLETFKFIVLPRREPNGNPGPPSKGKWYTEWLSGHKFLKGVDIGPQSSSQVREWFKSKGESLDRCNAEMWIRDLDVVRYIKRNKLYGQSEDS